MCVFLYLLHTEYHNTPSTSKVRGSEDILAGPPSFKGLVWGVKICFSGMVWNLIEVQVRVRFRGLLGLVRVRAKESG